MSAFHSKQGYKDLLSHNSGQISKGPRRSIQKNEELTIDGYQEKEKNDIPHCHKSVRPSEIGSRIHQPLNPNVKDGVPYLRARYITDLLLNYVCSLLTLIEIEGWVVAADALPHPAIHTHSDSDIT